MKPKASPIHQLSDHLFWDIDRNGLDIERSKKTIVQRVLEYGLLKDWKILVKTYGIEEIANTACTIRDLDIKSATFVALVSGYDQNQFLCYSLKPSMPKHCIF